jgi:hypothetical protein
LVERIAVGPIAWLDDFIHDPRSAARPAIFLELVNEQRDKIQQQDHLNSGEVPNESPTEGGGCDKQARSVPVTTKKRHLKGSKRE